MSSKLSAALRRLKPHKQVVALSRRADAQLNFVPSAPAVGTGLLLDTTVYVDALQDRLPAEVEQLLRVGISNHSSIAVAELAFAFGRLDLADKRTPATLGRISNAIAAMPAHRLSAPDHLAFVQGSIAAGTLARLQNLPDSDRCRVLNDAFLFFHALDQGLFLLTRNLADFDYLQQLVPAGRVLFYRQKP